MSKKNRNLIIILFIIFFSSPFIVTIQDHKRLKKIYELRERLTAPTNFNKIRVDNLYKGYKDGLRGEELEEWALRETLIHLMKEQRELLDEYNRLN